MKEVRIKREELYRQENGYRAAPFNFRFNAAMVDLLRSKGIRCEAPKSITDWYEEGSVKISPPFECERCLMTGDLIIRQGKHDA